LAAACEHKKMLLKLNNKKNPFTVKSVNNEDVVDNQEEVIEACRKYDENDDLALLDTIGETLIDLKIIKNDGRI